MTEIRESVDDVRRDLVRLQARVRSLDDQRLHEPDPTITPFQAFCLPMAYGIAMGMAAASAWIRSFDKPAPTHRVHDADGDDFIPERDLLSNRVIH